MNRVVKFFKKSVLPNQNVHDANVFRALNTVKKLCKLVLKIL